MPRERSMDGCQVDYPQWLVSQGSEALDNLMDAAETLVSIHEALVNDGLSILNELLRDENDQVIETWAHYPSDDCLDTISGAMFYYHAHDPEGWERNEHGHFHLFLRTSTEVSFSHVMAISMTAQGLPNGLFATNRWVTDEAVLPAEELLHLVQARWEITRARPSWMVAQWLTALVKLLQPYTEKLLKQRDMALGVHAGRQPSGVLTEDRSIHLLSELPLDLMEIMAAVQNEAIRRNHLCQRSQGATLDPTIHSAGMSWKHPQ